MVICTFLMKLCGVCLELTSEEVSVAVGFAPALFVVGHSRHLLSRGAAHGLIPSPLSPSHLRETDNTFSKEADSTRLKSEQTISSISGSAGLRTTDHQEKKTHLS